MITTLVVILGAVLFVTGIYGLAGAWWACLTGGVLLIVWAWLDELGKATEPKQGSK